MPKNFSISKIIDKPPNLFGGRISTQESVRFTKNLASLLKAGLPLSKALNLMERQINSQEFKKVIRRLNAEINNGAAFSAALKNYANLFPDILINLTEVGENCGNLAEGLDRVSLYLEQRLEFRRKLISALTYPFLVLGLSFLSVLFLIYFILPALTSFFSDFNMPLPFITRAIVAVGKGITEYSLVIWAILGLILGGLFFMRRQPRFSLYLDRIILNLPLIGNLYQRLILERITESLSLTLESGTSLIAALDIAGKSASNPIYRQAIEEITEEIKMGSKLGESLKAKGIFPEILVELVSAGEESGSLSKMFSEAAQYFKKEIDYSLRQITSLVAPVSTLVVSLIVGVIVLSMFLPMINMLDYLGMQ